MVQVVRAQIRGTPEYGGTFTAIAPITASGRDSDAGHMQWSSDPYLKKTPDGTGIQASDVGVGAAVAFEIAGSRNHYHCPMARTIMLGTPSDDYLRFVACSYRGIDAMLALARPGNTMEQLYWAYQNTLLSEGYSKTSRVGYSFGIGFAPDWGEKTVSCRPGDETVLAAGMCLHLIAGAGDGYVFEASEAIIITTEGPPEMLHDPKRRHLVIQPVVVVEEHETVAPLLEMEASSCLPPRQVSTGSSREDELGFEMEPAEMMEVDPDCTTRERYIPRPSKNTKSAQPRRIQAHPNSEGPIMATSAPAALLGARPPCFNANYDMEGMPEWLARRAPFRKILEEQTERRRSGKFGERRVFSESTEDIMAVHRML